MADAVVDRVGTDDDTTKSLAKSFLKRRYKAAFDQYPWKEAHTTFQFHAVENDVILPDWVDKVVQVRGDDAETSRNLRMVSRQTVMLVAPKAITEEGTRIAYTLLPSIAVHTHPGGNMVTVQSSDAGDTTQEVRIRGLHNGLTIEETIALAGLTALTSVNYYSEITHFSKPATTGWVTMKSTATGTPELGVILAEERERRYRRLQLIRDFEAGEDADVITVLAKRRCIPLLHDNDTPQIDNIDDALVAFAVADLLKRERQYAKAQMELQEAVALLNMTVLAERDQEQNLVQIIPADYQYVEQSSVY